ncbi:elicitor-responsive protein 3-like [Aristolochia californica]|uniref:elicitor-responsive protein 3-like n=1 Tax=Aristolochia californica TaxID=171875 RepID=UPI0035E25A17
MPEGTLEVLLIAAKGLENTDFLCNMDPYVILTFTSQEQKSSVASGKGSDPEWNETFMFTISEGASDLKIKIMDSDTGTEDDYVGEATIPLEPLFLEGNIPPAAYNVVKEEEYRGEVKIGLKFVPEERNDRGYNVAEEGNYGGWNQSS